MFSLLAPVEADRASSPSDPAIERKAHHAVTIAGATAATVIAVVLLFAALAFGTVALRVALYSVGHAELSPTPRIGACASPSSGSSTPSTTLTPPCGGLGGALRDQRPVLPRKMIQY